jgi:hypothetical protein
LIELSLFIGDLARAAQTAFAKTASTAAEDLRFRDGYTRPSGWHHAGMALKQDASSAGAACDLNDGIEHADRHSRVQTRRLPDLVKGRVYDAPENVDPCATSRSRP